MDKIIDGHRQGDVLLVARETRPAVDAPRKIAREGRRIVLMHGEVTGHAHAVLDRDVEYVETGTADAAERWLVTGRGGATLTHEEHSAHTLLPDQTYEQWFQYEYEPEAIRRVAD